MISVWDVTKCHVLNPTIIINYSCYSVVIVVISSSAPTQVSSYRLVRLSRSPDWRLVRDTEPACELTLLYAKIDKFGLATVLPINLKALFSLR